MTMIWDRGIIEGQGSSLERLVHVLLDQLGRTIIDKTGLTGTYDYTLNWTPDDAPPRAGERMAARQEATVRRTPAGRSWL